MARSFGKGQVVYVTYRGSVKYLFRSRLKASLRNDYGQVVVNDFATVGVNQVVVAPQFPRPRVGTVIDAVEGYENSYISNPPPASFEGSSKRGSKYKGLALNQVRQRLVYVTINGIKYGWYLNKSVPDGALGTLGISIATEADLDTIFLSPDFPKPPRVKQVSNATKNWTTFYDPSVRSAISSNANYAEIDGGLSTVEQLAELFGGSTSSANLDDTEGSTVPI